MLPDQLQTHHPKHLPMDSSVCLWSLCISYSCKVEDKDYPSTNHKNARICNQNLHIKVKITALHDCLFFFAQISTNSSAQEQFSLSASCLSHHWTQKSLYPQPGGHHSCREDSFFGAGKTSKFFLSLADSDKKRKKSREEVKWTWMLWRAMVWLVQREQMPGRLLNVSGMVQTLKIVYVRNEDQNLHRTSEQSTRKWSLKTFLQNEELF